MNNLSFIAKKIAEAREIRDKRAETWDEIYGLFRNKIEKNRLIQRQSVSIPVMKYSIKTILKEIDDMPSLIFKEIGNDEQKEIFYNEFWKFNSKRNKLVIKDIVDKKQVLLFGRSFKKINLVDGKIFFSVIDPKDVLVGVETDPSDLDQTDFFGEENIVMTFYDFFENYKDYVEKSKFEEVLKKIKSSESKENIKRKYERLERMGYPVDGLVYSEDNPIVSLTEVYFKFKEDGSDDFEFFYGLVINDEEVIFYRPLDTVLGQTKDDFWKNHLPYTSWAEDVENSDFWCDGIGDTLRIPHKVLSAWFSQLVENRTLRNLGMHFYNSTVPEFNPQTYVPRAFGFYPVPGDPNQIIRRIDIPDLSESLDEMQFILNIVERATATTTTQQGVINEKKVTLGEIQLALNEAKERTKSMGIFYLEAWEDFGNKYIKFLEANRKLIAPVEVLKKGRFSNNVYKKIIKGNDWWSKEGFLVDVVAVMPGEQIEEIQKLQLAKSLMPNNLELEKIIKRKSLEFSNLSFNEIARILEEEERNEESSLVNNENNFGENNLGLMNNV